MKLINITNKISQEQVKKWKASIHIEKFTSNNGDCWQTSQRVFGTEFLTESLMKLVGQSSSVLIVLKKPFEKIKSYGEVHSYSLQIDVHSKTCAPEMDHHQPVYTSICWFWSSDTLFPPREKCWQSLLNHGIRNTKLVISLFTS